MLHMVISVIDPKGIDVRWIGIVRLQIVCRNW